LSASVSLLRRRSHSRLLVLPTVLLSQHHLLAGLSPLHLVSDSSLALGIAPFSIGVPYVLELLALGVSLPLLISDSYPQLYSSLLRHRLHTTTLPLSSLVSLLFYPPLSLLIENTQTFPVEQSSLQLYNVQIGVSTWSSQALWGGAGSRWKGLGFSLCAALSQLAGPRISGLGGVESRRSLGGVDDVVKDKDQRFEIRDGGGVGVGIIAKVSKLREEK
jgi:hypothetical protein